MLDAAASEAAPGDAFVDYMGELELAYGRADDRLGSVEREIVVAGSRLRIRIAGAELAEVVAPPFGHLLADDRADAEIEIRGWDVSRSGVRMPVGRWGSDIDALDPGGDPAPGWVWARFGEAHRAVLHRETGFLVAVDLNRRRAVLVSQSADRTNWFERASPLQTPLHWLLGATSRRLLHAATVGTRDGAVLVIGPSGSGKSTLSIACLVAGRDFLSDDIAFVSLDDGTTAHSLYSTAKLDRASLARFPELRAQVVNPEFHGDEKAIVRLFPRFSEQLRASAPLRALIVPQISGIDAVAVNRTSPASALRALGPSTLVGIPGEAAVGMRIIGQLVRRLPSYAVELGSDSAANASAVREVIADAV